MENSLGETNPRSDIIEGRKRRLETGGTDRINDKNAWEDNNLIINRGRWLLPPFPQKFHCRRKALFCAHKRHVIACD